MKSNRILSPFLFALFISIIFSNTANATISQNPIGDIPFPFPHGSLNMVRGVKSSINHGGYDMNLHHGNRNETTTKYIEDTKRKVNGSCLDYGVPILSSTNGTVDRVQQSGYNNAWGTNVKIWDEMNQVTHFYAHMVVDGALVEVGEQVKAGQIIGLMGSTGLSEGNECTIEKEHPTSGKKDTILVDGVHLHHEIRDTKSISHPFNSYIGKEIYHTPYKGTYHSTTRMLDPTGYWQKYGYRYDYILPKEAMDGGDPHSTKINSITPLTVTAGEITTFNINGEILPQDTEIDLDACIGEIEWIKNENGRRDMENQQFRCRINQAGKVKGAVRIPDIKVDGKPLEMNFELNALPEGKIAGLPSYKGYPTLPNHAKPGDKIVLTIDGENMPGDLTLDMPACSDIRYFERSTDHQTIECTVSPHIYDDEGNLQNDLLTHDVQILNGEGEVVADADLVVDHRLQIESITPATAYFGQKTSFTLKGKGVHNLKTFHLDECRDLVILSQSDIKDQVVIQCTLPMPESFFSPLMPNSLKRKTLNLYVKEKPGGQLILAGKIEAIAAPDTWVESVNPYQPFLGENTHFKISGKQLPDDLLYWMDHCGQGELKAGGSQIARFDCKPEVIGGEAARSRIEKAARGVGENPEALIKEIEKQRRLVEIKYPRAYSTDVNTATVIYRGYILPIHRDFAELYEYALDGVISEKAPSTHQLDETDNEAIIQYILSNRGGYSNTFLKKLGWKNSNSNYSMLNCSPGLSRSSRSYLNSKNSGAALNLSGNCAHGTEKILIGEDMERLYPDKNIE